MAMYLILCQLLPYQHAGDLIEVLAWMAVSSVRTHSATLGAAQTFAAPVVEVEVTGAGESQPHWLAPGRVTQASLESASCPLGFQL